MKFISPSQDPWRAVVGEDGPMVTFSPAAHCLLTLTQWNAARASWPCDVPVGLLLDNDVDVEDLQADLHRVALIALQFPKWTDGRAYSQARILRARLRYAGEVRAVGEVLVDMLPLLQRTGVDAVVMRADQSRDAAEHALQFFAGHYQGDVRHTQPLFARPTGEEYPAKQDFNQAGAAI